MTTISKHSDKYINRAVEKAKAAIQFQDIVMHPGMWQLMDVAIQHLEGSNRCPIYELVT